MKNKAGKPISIASTERDITGRKKNEEELKRQSEKIKACAYSVIHDLKVPSIGVCGLAARLQQEYGHLLDEKGRAYCQQIRRGTEQIAALAEKVNMYISTEESPVRVETVNLSEMMKTLRQEFRMQILHRRIEWSHPGSLPEIRADSVLLLRALRNLVDNALKHGGENLSKIHIRYQQSDEFHVLSVTDDGDGIDCEKWEALFQPFVRQCASLKVEGTGLGFAIVKEVAELHGRKVWAGAAPGKGAASSLAVSSTL